MRREDYVLQERDHAPLGSKSPNNSSKQEYGDKLSLPKPGGGRDAFEILVASNQISTAEHLKELYTKN